ncbi:oxidoreductase [Kitasatospora xanthocidica]|uniref:Gfo/Idh/MocA family protein n=1 Tax=Kitasatospora xanthocidica TaxID=83382 RepID=UPI0019BC6B97|nr:Gfo/Idh/MocA family oxidoreductase [Kitasatospora xanthocidica]GHF89610.1 oxidoreductase [Kitasatospora xanthocidica]
MDQNRLEPPALRMGVLGCSDIAWRRALPALAADPSVELVAVASREEGKARRFAERFGCEAVTGYRALVDRADVDGLYVPVPAALHEPWVEAALRAGKHVLCEKPLTVDASATRRLAALAAARGLVLLENFMFQFHAQHQAVRDLLEQGVIGELRGVRAVFTIPALHPDDIRYRPELGGGCLLDVGGYPVRTAQLFLGPDLRVAGAVAVRDPGSGVDVAGAALLVSTEGVSAQLTYGMSHGYRSAYELAGSEGRIVLDRAYTPPADHRPVLRVETKGGSEEITLPADDQWAELVRVFTEAARGARNLDRYSELTLRQAELVEGIQRAAGLR